MKRRLLHVGLSGGIASGKSTVGRVFAELGALVVDADRLAHEAIEPDGEAYPEVVAAFGAGILDDERRIVRPALAKIVFADPEARTRLERIVHPIVRERFRQRVSDWAETTPDSPVAVFEAALLVETGAYLDFSRLLIVHCPVETQIERLAARDGLSREQALARIRAQAPIEKKLELADYTVDTEGTLDETLRRAHDVYAKICLDAFG